MNRAPGPNDKWWSDHIRKCGGTFQKIREPERVEKPTKSKRGNKIEETKSGPIDKFLSPHKPQTVKKSEDIEDDPQPKKFKIDPNGHQLSKDPPPGPCNRDDLNKMRDWSKLGVPSSSSSSQSSHPLGKQKLMSDYLEGSQNSQQKSQNKIKIEQAKMTDCPVCGKEVETNSINTHLDICLNQALLGDEISQPSCSKSSESPEVVNLDEEEEKQCDPNVVPCPVCNRLVNISEIQAHVDICLT
jgi:endogenous inhibitor of DNA gyrase (YacG/DUF329 family)